MFRPLSDSEKKQALTDGAVGAIKEVRRAAPELERLSRTAATVFTAFLPKFSPTLEVVQAPFPSEKKGSPFEELWSVNPKVTFE